MPYGSARLPQGNALQIEVENALPQTSRPRRGRSRSFRTSSGRRTSWCSRARGTGSRITIPFDVPEDGDYELYAQMAQGSDYGVYTVAARRQAARAARSRARAGRGRTARRPSSTATPYETYVGDGLPDRLAASDEGPAHADVRVRRQARGFQRLHARRGRHRAREDRSRRLGRGRQREGAQESLGQRGRSRDRPLGPRCHHARPRRDGAQGSRPRGAARPSGSREGAEGPGSERPSDGGQRDRRDRQGCGSRGAGPHRGLLRRRTSRSTSCARAPRRSARSESRPRRRRCRC